jgi:hypothetical protein
MRSPAGISLKALIAAINENLGKPIVFLVIQP